MDGEVRRKRLRGLGESLCLCPLQPAMRTRNVSSELVWGIVKDNSSFLVKRRQTGRCVSGNKGPQFTTEPGNVAGINSYKYSGLANAKAVGLSAGASGGAVLTTKTRKSSRVSKVRCPPPADCCMLRARHPCACVCPAAGEAVQHRLHVARLPASCEDDQEGDGQLPARPAERCPHAPCTHPSPPAHSSSDSRGAHPPFVSRAAALAKWSVLHAAQKRTEKAK